MAAAATGNNIVTDLQRYLSYIHEDVRGHPLASIRGAALSARLRALVEGAIQRIKHRQMQAGVLAPIRALLRDVSAFTAVLKNSSIIRLLTSRDTVAQQLRAFQLRISNLANRLQVLVRPFLSADDIRTTSQDKVFFNQLLDRYRANPELLASLVRTIRPEQLRQLHPILASGLYSRPNAIVAAGEVDFAQKARRAIEHRFAVSSPSSIGSPLHQLPVSPALHARRPSNSFSPPPIPSPLRSAHFADSALHGGGLSPQPALQPLRSPLLASLSQGELHSLAQSVPARPFGSPGSHVSSLDLGAAFSPDPILYEDTHISTSFDQPFPATSNSVHNFPSTSGATHLPPPTQQHPHPHFANPLLSPRSVPLPASPLLQASVPIRPIAIRYYDANLGKFMEWLPFHGWLWQAPHSVDAATDHHNQVIQAQSIVTVVAQFAGLDGTQRQAILDHISLPSRAPSLLRHAAEGDKLRVLRLFSIRGVIWLACIPLTGGKPGFVPLKATICHGNPPLSLPRLLAAPIHGSIRSFNATYRFKDSRGQWRVVPCTGVVQPFRISYHERVSHSVPGLPQPQIHWLHFPYERVLGLIRAPSSNQADLVVLDRGMSREVQMHFGSAIEAMHFVEDVEHMRLITRKILELRERRRREAELRQANATLTRSANAAAAAAAGHGQTSAFGAPGGASSGLGVPPSPRLAPMSPNLQAVSGMGISPFLGPQHMGDLGDGSQSPHLSQLGSPRLGPLF